MNNVCANSDFLCVLVNEFLNSPGFPFRLGLMIAVALVLGFVIFEDYRKLWKWVLTGLVYILFQEWLRATYFAAIEAEFTGRSVILALFASSLFGLGAMAGAYIARRVVGVKYIESDNILEIISMTMKTNTIYGRKDRDKNKDNQEKDNQ